MNEKGQAPIKMMVAAFLSLVIFLVVFETLKTGGVDPNLSAILAVAAGFGSFTVILKLPIG